MLEEWINQMKSETLEFIEKSKYVHMKLDVKEQEIAIELKNDKEQEMSWQDTLKEFQRIAKINMDVLIAENVFSDKEENQSSTWCKSISWKLENIKQCLREYQKLLVTYEQTKMKVIEDKINIIGDISVKEQFQQMDSQVLLRKFHDRINTELADVQVLDADRMKRLNVISVALDACDMPSYYHYLIDIQDGQATAKLKMINVIIPRCSQSIQVVQD